MLDRGVTNGRRKVTAVFNARARGLAWAKLRAMLASRTAFVIASLVAMLGGACPGAGERRQQEKMARDVEPAAVVPTPMGTLTVRRAKVRVYADAAYRAQNRRWEDKVAAQLRDASRIFEPTIGLGLDLADTRAWERKADSSDMTAMIKELEALDPADDVDFVIGLVDALPQVSTSFHQLGLARPLGKHLLVRGMNDVKEIQLFEQVFDTLPDDQRKRLYSERKKHKELVVLLHELAHALGALHDDVPSRLVFPTYDHSQSSFAEPTARLMRVAVEGRFGGKAGAAQALIAFLRSTNHAGWDDKERDQLIELLEAEATGTRPIDPGLELGKSVRPSDREKYASAVQLAEGGAFHEAWELAEPLIGYYPDEPAVAVLACRLAMNLSGTDDSAIQRCRRAAKLTPDDPEPTLFVATALASKGKRDEAVAALADAERQIGAARGDRAPLWAKLAAAYQSLGAITAAERAAVPGKAEPVLVWAALTRARFGVPPQSHKGGIAAKDEAAYVESIKKLLQHIYARQFKEAEALAKTLGRTYPGAPGVDIAVCDLEIRKKRYDQARARCDRAIATYEESSWGHYLLALLDKRAKKADAAIAHLRRAIALDPELRHAYQVLGELYKAGGKTEERAALDAAYQKQFGAPL